MFCPKVSLERWLTKPDIQLKLAGRWRHQQLFEQTKDQEKVGVLHLQCTSEQA